MRRFGLMLFVTTSAGVLLGGCISRQEMALRHRAACETYGFTPGTEPYANCLLQLDVGDYGYGHHGRRRAWAPSHPPMSQVPGAKP